MTITRLTGRARTVLNFGHGEEAKGVISTVIAHTHDYAKDNRITFVGPVILDKATIEHIRYILIPIIDSILDSLGLEKKNYELSIVNPGAASVFDLGVEITGFSADVPVLLAMLSAALNMPVPEDIVTTGHISSSDGDIAVVKAIPAKVAACIEEKSVHSFIYPEIDRDSSLAMLSPVEKEKAQIALINAKGSLKISATSNISDLIQQIFNDEAIVIASLQKGFFLIKIRQESGSNPIKRSIRFLTEDNVSRFWKVLEKYFLSGQSDMAKKLLLAFLNFHIQSKAYPREFGRRLIQLLRSLPPVTRKIKIEFPLLPTLACVSLTQFATELDADDIRLLYEAAEGKEIWSRNDIEKKLVHTNIQSNEEEQEKQVNSIVSQISSDALAKTVSMPIDTARATYMIDSLTISSNEEFYDIISAFYLHLQRHFHSVSESVDINTVRADAIALVERAFDDKGGFKAAMNEANNPVNGGMKFILDVLTEQFKAECQAKHVNRIIKEAITPLDTNAQISLISVLLKRLKSHLPEEIANSPPERFIEHYEIIVKAYVRSLDKINEVFRRF